MFKDINSSIFRIIYRFGKLTWNNYIFERQNTTMVKLFKERVAREPEKTCYYFEDQTWTVADVSIVSGTEKMVTTNGNSLPSIYIVSECSERLLA
jgi:hypothetical protein